MIFALCLQNLVLDFHRDWSIAAIAGAFGEKRTSWYDYTTGQTDPGIGKVQHWLVTWNKAQEPKLEIRLDGVSVEILVGGEAVRFREDSEIP